LPQSHDSQTQADEYMPSTVPTLQLAVGKGLTGDVAMSTKSNIAVIAAFLTALAAPAYATNGDIGLSNHGQGASQSGRASAVDARARASVNTRRESRPRNAEGASSTFDFNLIGHN
jgi:hypothetical protein